MTRLATFLKTYSHLKISIRYVGTLDGGFLVEIYNSTWDYNCSEPIFTRFIPDFEISMLNCDFETIVMTQIENWWWRECELCK